MSASNAVSDRVRLVRPAFIIAAVKAWGHRRNPSFTQRGPWFGNAENEVRGSVTAKAPAHPDRKYTFTGSW